MCGILDGGCDNIVTNHLRNRVFHSRLDHARTASLCRRENVAKVQIMGEHDEAFFLRKRHDLGIKSFGIVNV